MCSPSSKMLQIYDTQAVVDRTHVGLHLPLLPQMHLCYDFPLSIGHG